MSKIILKPLRSRKQLRNVSFKDVESAGFTDEDEQFFTISFNMGNGLKQDLTVIFETRSPRLYISGEYKD